MKRFFTVFVVAVVALVGSVVSAEVISQEVAKQTADNFLSLDSEWQGAGEAAIRLIEKNDAPVYYIVEYKAGGWAVVSAQSSSTPVVAYNPTGVYETPAPMQAVLDAYAGRVVESANQEAAVEHEGWNRVRQRKPAADPISTPDVEPLIKMDLNQGDPYNKYCPKIGSERTLVGCVAVGMAQAMMVQRYPVRPQGKHSYTCEGVGSLSVDYDKEAEYDWDAMFAEDYDEVARLLYHCGVSVNMGYGVDGSGTGDSPVPTALVKYFGYDDSFIELIDKPADGAGWLETLLDEIYLGRVVIYFGSNETSGHCWNIDGWKKSTQMVHVNWGWGGVGNSYFNIDAMQDKYQGMSFPNNNSAVIGVGSPTTAPYDIKLSTAKFVAGTAAGVALADVTVSCEDPEAVLSFEISGSKNPITGKYGKSPYSVQDGKLVSSDVIEDTNKFKYMHMTVTNTHTGESFAKEFTIQVVDGGAVEAVLSDAMRVYPSVADNTLSIEVPVVGGEYAIYSVSGVQVSAGELSQYKTDVDVARLAAGTYILRYVHNTGVGVKTFIKK